MWTTISGHLRLHSVMMGGVHLLEKMMIEDVAILLVSIKLVDIRWLTHICLRLPP